MSFTSPSFTYNKIQPRKLCQPNSGLTVGPLHKLKGWKRFEVLSFKVPLWQNRISRFTGFLHFAVGKNQNYGPDRSSPTGNETPQIPLAQEKVPCVARTVETCREKGQSLSNAWVSAESQGIGVVHDPRGFLCMCVRICQTCHSDANSNWLGEFLPGPGSQK